MNTSEMIVYLIFHLFLVDSITIYVSLDQESKLSMANHDYVILKPDVIPS